MEYFTRSWALGELTDAEFDKSLADYRGYLASLDPKGSVRHLADNISLNDAWIDRLTVESGGVSLLLLTGDLRRGYWRTTINYVGARIIFGQDALERAVQYRPTEIWYDEFSGRSRNMVHRFMLVEPHSTVDRGEVHIAFADLDFSESPADARTLSALPPAALGLSEPSN